MWMAGDEYGGSGGSKPEVTVPPECFRKGFCGTHPPLHLGR